MRADSKLSSLSCSSSCFLVKPHRLIHRMLSSICRGGAVSSLSDPTWDCKARLDSPVETSCRPSISNPMGSVEVQARVVDGMALIEKI